MLLRRSDLLSGWSEASPAPPKVPNLTCPAVNPPGSAVEIGRAQSPTWQRSQNGPFASETTYAYASAAQQTGVWRAVARPAFTRCAALALTAGSGGGVQFTVQRKQALALPGLPAAHRYRISGTATGSGQSVAVYLDVVLLGHGQAIAALSLSSFEAPVSTKLELRLARAAARRLP